MKSLSKISIGAFLTTLALQFGVMANPYFAGGPVPGGNIQHFPAHYHVIVSVAIDGSSIEIEDGSQWKVPSSQAYEVSNWKTNDPVVISPNYSCLSGCKYYLTNKNRGSYVDGNLSLGPIIGGNNTYRIIYLNPYDGEVYLQPEGPGGYGNEIHWCVELGDRHIMKNWTMNQAVIVGANDNWFSSWFSNCNCILINSERNTYVRAQEY